MSPEKMQKLISYQVNDVLDDLDVTDAQRKQVNGIASEVSKDMMARHKQHKQEHLALLRELETQEANPQRLHALLDQKLDELREMSHQRLDDLLRVNAILTPAQRAKLLALAREHLEER